MIIGLIIVLFILSFVFLEIGCGDYMHDTVHFTIAGILCVLGIIVLIFRMFSWIY